VEPHFEKKSTKVLKRGSAEVKKLESWQACKLAGRVRAKARKD
jgi:hypothetical protein